MRETSTHRSSLPSRLHIGSLGQLVSLVGQDLVLTEYVGVSQARINLFAEATDDRQWIHVDVERARESSPFGRTIAHGFLTLSLLSAVLTRAITIEDVRMGINAGLNYVRFPSTVPAEGAIRARIHLKSVKTLQNGVDACWFITVHCKGSLFPCCLTEWIVRYLS